MNAKRYQAISTVLLLFGLLQVSAMAKPEDYGFPPTLSPQSTVSLGDVLRREDLTPAQKTDVLICWLKKEMQDPTPTSATNRGELRSSGYTKSLVAWVLIECADPLDLEKQIADPKTSPELREALTLTLGMMGDCRQIPKLAKILNTDPEPYYRSLAARALRRMGTTEVIPVLEEALKYDLTVEAVTPSGRKIVHHPVKDEVETGLRALKDSRYVEIYRKRAEEFDARLAEARKKAAAGASGKEAAHQP